MEAHVLLCARDPAVVEAVEVCAAALEVPLRVAHHPDEVRAEWHEAALRLVSTEVAARWSGVAPGSAYIVGSAPSELARCSAALGLPVLPLPDEAGHMSQAMGAAVRRVATQGQVVSVVGASGGVGVSTLVASIVLLAAANGGRSAAVDLAQAGGGLDLLVGAETVEGVRWPDLSRARGELGDLLGMLPSVEGAGFLSQGREPAAAPDAAAVAAVLGSLTRSADLVVVDAGREKPPAESDQVVLLVGADVRSVASARTLAEGRSIGATCVAVRQGPGRSIPAEVISRSLGLPCVGVFRHDTALPRLAELGLPPMVGPSRRHRREVAGMLKAVRGG